MLLIAVIEMAEATSKEVCNEAQNASNHQLLISRPSERCQKRRKVAYGSQSSSVTIQSRDSLDMRLEIEISEI